MTVRQGWYEGFQYGAGHPAFPPDNPYYKSDLPMNDTPDNALLANVYIEGYKNGQYDAMGGFVLADRDNPYHNIRQHLTELTHEEIVAIIEDVQHLRDLATLELARRDPGLP